MDTEFMLSVRWFAQTIESCRLITQQMVAEVIRDDLAQLPVGTTTRGVLLANYGQPEVAVLGEIEPEALYFCPDTRSFVAATIDKSLLLVRVRSDLSGKVSHAAFTLKPQQYLQVVMAHRT